MADEVRVEVPDPGAMRELGAAVAQVLRPGQLVVLSGPVGAGKTTFVQGAAAALGVTEPVTSPTFVLARVHRGSVCSVVHVDAYRLADPRDLAALDLEDELAHAIAFVEWGGHVVDDPESVVISIDRGRSDDVRVVTLPAALAAAAAGAAK